MRTKLIEVTCEDCFDTQIFEDQPNTSFEIRSAGWKRVEGQDFCKKCLEKVMEKAKKRVAA